MTTPDFIVRGRRVLAGDAAEPAPASVYIQHGVITAVAPFDEAPPGSRIYDAGDDIVMPGIVDTHVHINEPGRMEWEGFTSGTRAAAAGGITTLIEMPLNSIPATTSAAAFREKLAAATGKLWADCGFWGGVVPGNLHELGPMRQEGAFGFKCFLVPSGVEEFKHVGEDELRAAMPVLAELDAPLLAHSEDPKIIDAASQAAAKLPANQYSSWLASRPSTAESSAIELLVRLAAVARNRLHIVHVSSVEGLEAIRRAKNAGLAISAETCPHYLTFAASENKDFGSKPPGGCGIPDGATEFKCAPPIRADENRERLWDALGEGTLDFIASDHSPCPPEMKRKETGDFFSAWGGIASLELSLPAVWTSARRHGYAVGRLTEWLCRGPARLAGLARRKGSIAVGYDADFVIWNPEAAFLVDPERLHQRHKLTPYTGRALQGAVTATFLRGRKIFERGEFPAGPVGNILKRTGT
jgi:allantoinase